VNLTEDIIIAGVRAVREVRARRIEFCTPKFLVQMPLASSINPLQLLCVYCIDATPRPRSRFGAVITYFPITQLRDFQSSYHETFVVLALQVHATHGGEKLEIAFPGGSRKGCIGSVGAGVHLCKRRPQLNFKTLWI
jgi:hypothetical protein